ncbi:MAG: electron transfer flavoprotein subunit beta/FixA family protein [Promethearchaeota archaeon]
MTLHIIVLIKQVPDPKGYVGIKEDGTLDREKASSIINPYDKNALEAALTIKEKSDAKITAVSMGPPKARDVLREALAMGADEAVLLSDKRLPGSDTLATSYALACAIKKLDCYDLILCGMEASDGNTGQVGPGVAERLGIPQITYVDNLKVGGKYAEARRMLEGGYEIARVKLPALLTITNTANEPRGTTFAGIIRATKMPLTALSTKDIGVDECKIGLSGSPTKIRKIEKMISQRDRYMVEGETIDEVIDNFLKRLEEDDVSLGNSYERRI